MVHDMLVVLVAVFLHHAHIVVLRASSNIRVLLVLIVCPFTTFAQLEKIGNAR